MRALVQSLEHDRVLERNVVVVLLFLAPLSTIGYRGLPVGIAGGAIALGAVLLSQLRHYRGAGAIIVLAIVCVLSIPLIAGPSVDTNARARTLVNFAAVLISFGLVLWGRRLLGIRQTALLFGGGALVQAVLDRSGWQDNAWKYALAWPVAVVLLAAAERWGTPARIATLTLIAAVSVNYQFRSFAAIAAVTAVLVVWRSKPADRQWHRPRLRYLLLLAVIVWAVVPIGTRVALADYLGPNIQHSVDVQTHSGTQSIIRGARPEWAATWALMKDHPEGYGAGAILNAQETEVATRALASAGAEVNGSYVQDYLLGERFDLHSVVADLWMDFGPAGLLFGLVIAGWLVLGLGRLLANGCVSPLLVFMPMLALWDLAFSPIGNLPHVLVAVALVLPTTELQAHRLGVDFRVGKVAGSAAGRVPEVPAKSWVAEVPRNETGARLGHGRHA